MSEHARAVIIGGGITGCSLAYHLAKKGWSDIVLLEKDILTSGATSHAAGLVTQFHPSPTMMKMREISLNLYRELAAVHGDAAGWNEVGSVRVASSKEQLQTLRRKVSQARALGQELEIISSEEALKLFQYMSGESLYGAIHLPHDGHLEPYLMTVLLARLAQEHGAELRTGVQVHGIELDPRGHIRSVVTDHGNIQTDIVINAAGIWAPRVSAMVGRSLPTSPINHQYMVTRPLKDGPVPRQTPVFRDPDHLIYVREETGGFLVGGFETEPVAWHPEGVPWDHARKALGSDWDQFESVMEGALFRMPCLEEAEPIKLIHHPDALTPDGEPIVGPQPGVPGFWLFAGLSLNGFGGGGGLGKVLAEWLVEGDPGIDLHEMDPRRFGKIWQDEKLVTERAREAYKYYYYPRYPHDEWEWERPKRVSPVHTNTEKLGAVYGQKNGWERVNFFRPGEASRRAGADQRRGWCWGQPDFFEDVGREHNAVRESAGLFDLSSFGKVEVQGPGALSFLQHLTTSNIDRPEGRLVYTQFLNKLGGIESDLIVVRRGENRFRLVCGSAFVDRDLGWLEMHVPEDGSVTITDVTEQEACLAIWGPRSREILNRIFDEDLSNDAFPYFTARELRIGSADTWVQRLSYAGELGYEIYSDPDDASALFESLLEAGTPDGLIPAGYKCLESLRLEKAYRYFGADIKPSTLPDEAGLSFCVDLEASDFMGKQAVIRARERGASRRLATLLVEGDPGCVFGGEAISDGSGVVGRVTSGGFGYTVGKNIALAYLPLGLDGKGTSFTIDSFGTEVGAVVSEDVLIDPTGKKLRG